MLHLITGGGHLVGISLGCRVWVRV
jgi:hypothetical protein